MDSQGRGLSESVWTSLDRKAGAVVELTVRQLRNKISTWAVLGLGTLLMVLLLVFYIDSVRDGFESIDNDGDSFDMDNDGYPMGQEWKYGTSDWDGESFPGSGNFIFQGQIDWNDPDRTVSGNKTWEGQAILNASWIDYDYTGGTWSNIIDWETYESNDCDEGAPFEDWWLPYASSCLQEDGTYAFNGRVRASGQLYVPEGSYLSWGIFTEVFYVEPDPPEMYIDEDGIDWAEGASGSQGFDDDGDCFRIGWITGDDWWEYQHEPDANRNGIPCDVVWAVDPVTGEVISIDPDDYVDEDPVDEEYAGESSHRAFVIASGKIAFVLLLGLFLPLFLALGLVRDETERGTLHYLLSKPIHRGEFIFYRVLGYMAVVSSFVIVLALLMALITSLIGPGDDLIRFGDFPVWVGIAAATILVLAAYGSLFNTIGLIMPKYGVYLCIIIGVWEFAMGFTSLFAPESSVTFLSISHWGLQMVDATVLAAWPDTLQYSQMSEAFGIDTGLQWIWKPPVHTLGTGNPYISIVTSITFLSIISGVLISMGSAIFRRKEIM